MKFSRQEFLILSGLSNETLDAGLEQEWVLPVEIGTESVFQVPISPELVSLDILRTVWELTEKVSK